jgi:esterase/lipase superfamily enzyme
MLFITNRAFQEGMTPFDENNEPIVPRSVNFNLSNHQAEQSVYFCHRNDEAQTYTEIGGKVFLTELKNSNAQEILLYVHGYSNFPELGIFQRAQELQDLFNQKSDGYIVVVPVIWPCDNQEGQMKYFNDQMAADQSGMAFARSFLKFLEWRKLNSTEDNPCTKRINILAHSMGNRVMRAAFASIVQYFLPQGMPLVFRNIFMASADVVNEALEPGQEGQHISTAARNVVVYYAADDLAMRASKVANLAEQVASRRLGHTGPEHIDKVNKNVYALDCDDFNTLYDTPLGHGYFASDNREHPGNPGLVFDHMWRCVETGRVLPISRSETRNAILTRGLLGESFIRG